MKVTMFHFMPYRDLPEEFPKGYASAWIDAPWWELADPNKVTDYYNWSIDELILAAKLGFDGVGVSGLSEPFLFLTHIQKSLGLLHGLLRRSVTSLGGDERVVISRHRQVETALRNLNSDFGERFARYSALVRGEQNGIGGKILMQDAPCPVDVNTVIRYETSAR